MTEPITPLPISVYLCASNEEKNLPRCLASVAGWVSEIIVLLNNTTDRSEEIARAHGAVIHHHAWIGYRDTKNVALGFTTQPWALALDSDEEVSPALKQAILQFFRGDHERYAGARFPRKVWFLGRWITHGDWYPDPSLRLFRRDQGRYTGSPEHDKIVVDGKVKWLPADLHHYSFPAISSHVSKINTFADYFLRRQLDAHKRWSAAANLFRPFWRFVRGYIVRRGFLDGFPGFYIAVGVAFATFVRYSRLYEHEQTQRWKDRKPEPGGPTLN